MNIIRPDYLTIVPLVLPLATQRRALRLTLGQVTASYAPLCRAPQDMKHVEL